MKLTDKISNHNIRAFLWHAGFLALAQNFMDVDTIIPAMLVEAGGNAFHIGLMTAIMMGGSSFTQLFFAPYISHKPYKKNIILTGINFRIFALIALGSILFQLSKNSSHQVIYLIFLFITIFALGGAFANIGYVDIIGKVIVQQRRKYFFSLKQIISGIAVMLSAFFAKWLLSVNVFPVNYSYSFFIGGLLLLLASIGFWKVKEDHPSDFKIKNLKHYFQVLWEEAAQNKKLLYFLGFVNTQGIAISFLPFVVLYARQYYNAGLEDTGIFLLNKVIGVVLVSLLVLLLSSRIKYNLILKINVVFTIVLVLAVMLTNNLLLLHYVFILGGIVFSLYNISTYGILLEISGTKKRALYAGFAGAGNILPALFPVFAGWIIEQLGFTYFFWIVVLVTGISIFFIKKLNCIK